MATPLIDNETMQGLITLRAKASKKKFDLLAELDALGEHDLCRALAQGYKAYDEAKLTPEQKTALDAARAELETAETATAEFLAVPFGEHLSSNPAFADWQSWSWDDVQKTYEELLADLRAKADAISKTVYDLENTRLTAATQAAYAVIGGKTRSSSGSTGQTLELGTWKLPFGKKLGTWFGLVDAFDKVEFWTTLHGKREKIWSLADLPAKTPITVTSPSYLRMVCHVYVKGPTRGKHYGTKGMDAIKLLADGTITSADVGSGGTGRKGSYCHRLDMSTADFRSGKTLAERVKDDDDDEKTDDEKSKVVAQAK